MIILNKKMLSTLLSCLLVSSSVPSLLADTPTVPCNEPQRSKTCKKFLTKNWRKITSSSSKMIRLGIIPIGGMVAITANKISKKIFSNPPPQKSDSVYWLEEYYYAINDSEKSIAKSKYIECMWRHISSNFSKFPGELKKFIEMIIRENYAYTSRYTYRFNTQNTYLRDDIILHMIDDINNMDDPSLSMSIQNFCKDDNAKVKFEGIMGKILDNMSEYKTKTMPELNEFLNKTIKNSGITKTGNNDTVEKILDDCQRLHKNSCNAMDKENIDSNLCELMNLKIRIENLLTNPTLKDEFKELCSELENYPSICEEFKKQYAENKRNHTPILPPKDKLLESHKNVSKITHNIERQIKACDYKSKLPRIINFFQSSYLQIVENKYEF